LSATRGEIEVFLHVPPNAGYETRRTRRSERSRTRSGPSFCARRSERAFGADRVSKDPREIGIPVECWAVKVLAA